MSVITFDVLGTPAPKGSNRAMLIRGRARFVAGGSSANQKKQKSWDVAVREAAVEAVGDISAPIFVGVAISLSVTFRMVRPAGHWATGKNAGQLKPSAPPYPAVAPDVDKLVRQLGDSLTGIVYDDDARIVTLHVGKRYADPRDEGATVTVAAAADRDLISHPRPAYRAGLQLVGEGAIVRGVDGLPERLLL